MTHDLDRATERLRPTERRCAVALWSHVTVPARGLMSPMQLLKPPSPRAMADAVAEFARRQTARGVRTI